MSKLKLVMLLMLLLNMAAYADNIPQTTNVQGRLTNPEGSPLINDTLQVIFGIYDAETGGTSLWEETDTVYTDKYGLFSQILGFEIPIPDTAFESPDRWLGIQVESDPEMTPRQRLTSVPYTFQALDADMVDGIHAIDFARKIDASNHNYGGVDTIFSIPHDKPFTLTIVERHANPGNNAVAFIHCVENDDYIAWLGYDGQGNMVKGRAYIGTDTIILTLAGGNITLKTPNYVSGGSIEHLRATSPSERIGILILY